MTSKNKKADGPSCACGKSDLYEEWKKLNEKTDKGVSEDDVDEKAPEEADPEE